MRSVEKDISDKQREQESLQNTIGWNEPHHEVDSSEAMKSHVSEQIRGKQEQNAYILQLERGLEDNKIERNSNSNELDQLEKELVPEETLKRKGIFTAGIRITRKENIYEKLKESFEEEQIRKINVKNYLDLHLLL